MTRQEWGRVYALLRLAWPRAEFGAEAAAVYHRGLSDLDVIDAEAAADELIRTSRWLPTVAEIRDAAREARRVRLDPPALPLLPEPPPTPEQLAARAENVRRIRAMLADWRKERVRPDAPNREEVPHAAP